MGNETDKYASSPDSVKSKKKSKNKPNAPDFYCITGMIKGKPGNILKEAIENSDNVLTKQTSQKINLNVVPGSLCCDIRKVYKFKDVLGGGHFGSVRVAYRRDEEPRKYYAVKSISKTNISDEDMKNLIREVDIISGLQHPNIIKFFETYHDEHYFHIVMELCTGKEVFGKIIEDGKQTEQTVSKIIAKVLHAISYCHSKGITHRDIKPENILFKSNDTDAEVKIIDFGLSRKYMTNEKMHTILGTPYYIAPEVLKGEYDEKCDVWSVGALTYIMLCGEPAFNGGSNNDIFNKIINEELKFPKEKWNQISPDAIDFIKQCMVKNPEKRTSASKAINHPWFSNILAKVHNEEYLNNGILNNLKNFSTPEKFKRMVLKFLTNMVSEKELKQLKQAFYAMDLDHSGYINVNELGHAFKNAGTSITEEEIHKIVEQAGDQMKGKIDYSEFLIASMNQKKNIKKEKLIQAFKYFDIDDSGYIDSADLKNALLRCGKKIVNEEEIEKIIDEVNIDNQKKISLETFMKLFEVE